MRKRKEVKPDVKPEVKDPKDVWVTVEYQTEVPTKRLHITETTWLEPGWGTNIDLCSQAVFIKGNEPPTAQFIRMRFTTRQLKKFISQAKAALKQKPKFIPTTLKKHLTIGVEKTWTVTYTKDKEK